MCENVLPGILLPFPNSHSSSAAPRELSLTLSLSRWERGLWPARSYPFSRVKRILWTGVFLPPLPPGEGWGEGESSLVPRPQRLLHKWPARLNRATEVMLIPPDRTSSRRKPGSSKPHSSRGKTRTGYLPRASSRVPRGTGMTERRLPDQRYGA